MGVTIDIFRQLLSGCDRNRRDETDQRAAAPGPLSTEEALSRTLARVESEYARATEANHGVTSGLLELDEAVHGWRPGELVFIGGERIEGTQPLLVQLLLHNGLDKSRPCAHLSPRRATERAVVALLSELSGLSKWSVRIGSLSDEQWPQLLKACGRLTAAEIFWDDTPWASTADWAEEHRWRQGDVFELFVPREETPQVMMLPVWGWVEAVYRYRLLWRPEDIETIDEMAFDVFEGPGGCVLVVHSCDGFNDRVDGVCGDYMQDRSSQVWEAPARVAEPPRSLVDIGTRSDVQNWCVDGVAPDIARWASTVDMSAIGLIGEASVVDHGELSEWLLEAAKRCYDEATFGWPQRNITVSETPRLVAHYPADRYRSGTGATWAFAYDGCVADQDFLLVLFCEKSKTDELKQQAQVVWGKDVEQAVSARGEEDGMLALIGWQLFDWHAATLESAIPF